MKKISIENLKSQFPIFKNTPNLVYLDTSATSQKPQCVIDEMVSFYTEKNANINRGAYELSRNATDMFDESRQVVADFLNAKSSSEIVFTRNSTESINLVMRTFAESNISFGDEIVVSVMEHHSNFVPWQIFAKEVGAVLKVIPLADDLTLDMDVFESLITQKTKLVAVTGMSNVLGFSPNISKIVELSHEVGAKVLVDGAQSSMHKKFDVVKSDVDFYVMSSHKMFGPNGVGVLYVKEAVLKDMKPFLYGGDMVASVTLHDSVFKDLPNCFEAGTPDIAGVVGFARALQFLEEIDIENIMNHEVFLAKKMVKIFDKFYGLKVLLPAGKIDSGILSFTVNGVHPHDIAEVFGSIGIAIRSGKHCAHPLHDALNLPATARISFGGYNTEKDVLAVENALEKVYEVFLV